jgi:hypothetical protein
LTDCLSIFTKERNEKERDSKEIDYLYSLDEKGNKEREKYNGVTVKNKSLHIRQDLCVKK